MRYLCMLTIMILLNSCNLNSANNEPLIVSSPDKRIQVEFLINEDGTPEYKIFKDGKALLDKSKLGFNLKNNFDLLTNFEIVKNETSVLDEVWSPVVGQFRSIRNNYNELTVFLKEKKGVEKRLELSFRVYNDGLGFRYNIPKQPNISKIEIVSEETQFNLAQDFKSWWIPGDFDSYEKIYNETRASEITTANTPVTFKANSGTYLSIHEANLTDYSDMTLLNKAGTTLLESNLVPWPDGIKVKGETPLKTPWRTIQIAEQAGELIESNLILNLNDPNKIEDTSWIKPMKYTGIWWTVHLGFETFEEGPHHAATTEKAFKMIDAASRLGIKGLLVEGWNKGWDKRNKSTEIPDFLNATDDYDLKAIVEYAKSKNIELIIHHETFGNIPHYEKYMEDAFKMIKDLGLSSVKGGYAGQNIKSVNQHKHGQYMVRHYRKQLELAAKYGIMLDIHEPVKQTGLRRTYPNLMTVEGVRGMEFEAWTSGNPPSHTVTIPFTRMLAGPVDYNAGIFDIKFNSIDDKPFNWRKPKSNYPRNPGPSVKTTLAKQLALHVVLFSPMQMAPDLPENYENHPAFKFIQDVGLDWDDTRVLNGDIGKYITVARKEKDTPNWFIGAMTNEGARNLNIDLSFLDKNKKYKATIYKDGEDAHWDNNPTSYTIDEMEVTSNTNLTLVLAAGGGQAISITPIN
ncbi:glycoside hydrolase family 97 protein [Tamlana sp. 2201CG12-4]|uniref:glycoside hydrolase family 97 protein n=1 Tax=Tamlana sp. 2201CG12-4 TaxID=3112582 RepID=UPI002DB82BA5|nr:glycoside hydrolase family 97 protein [Tamlana sp. 2201CG12-4]MEC3908653.1 glycoside hydrolase family 97 protein [Tamlana sp. 2201CG12-4]